MSGKLDWSERCSWGNQPPTHASLRPSPSKKLVPWAAKQTDRHTCTHINTLTDLREISMGREGVLGSRWGEGGGRQHCNRLLQELSPGRFHYQVWPQACVYLYIYVCVCARRYVCACLKCNDEHHPDRDLGKAEMSVNWNCHIHSKCLRWKLLLAHHRNHLALSSLFLAELAVKNLCVLFNYTIHIWLSSGVCQVLHTCMGERTTLALLGEACWCCNLLLSTSTCSLLPRTSLSVCHISRHSV